MVAEGRSRRRAAASTTGRKQPSAAYYVGYVDDEESVESILKKFEELDNVQKQLQAQKEQVTQDGEGEEAGDSAPESAGDEPVPQLETGLTEAQLEEVFKRTSMFSAKLLTSTKSDHYFVEDDEGWREDMYMRDRSDDEDYKTWSEDEELWEDLNDVHRRRGRARKEGRVPREKKEKEPRQKRLRLSHQHLLLASAYVHAGGQRAAIKKKEKVADPRQPTYVRIPPGPLPESWGHIIQPMAPPDETLPPCTKYVEVGEVVGSDIPKIAAGDVMCVLMDPPLLLPGETPTPGKVSVKDLEGLRLGDLIQSGFIFIWLEKELVSEIFELMGKWNFRYVENICWMQRNVNGSLVRRGSQYLPKSKLSCFIFRKDGDIELRHQRNPDVIVDFVHLDDGFKKPGQAYRKEHRPSAVYMTIETLLPDARCPCAPQTNTPRVHCGKLLELWAPPGVKREGWISVAQKETMA